MRILIILCSIFVCGGLHAQTQSDFDKAFKLYNQVIKGERKFENMTHTEQQQVLSIQRLYINSCANVDEKCVEVCNAANKLKSAAEDLASCAKKHDYSDDCGRKFKETRYQFDDYERAVSDVQNECS